MTGQDKEPMRDGRVGDSLERRFEKAVSPLQLFIADQTVGSLILGGCVLLALLLANSPAAHLYHTVLETPVGGFIGGWTLQKTVHHWINDALMAIFFFAIGLEIKREILAGELQDPRRSLPVIASAFGGMLLPAAIFLLFNAGSDTIRGWGIPMATDTAFAVGVLYLVRGRIPPALSTFLIALAIIDDIGAILVIALFYSDDLSLPYLGYTLFFFTILILFNLLGVRSPLCYWLVGGMVWLTLQHSGLHATLAGILVAMTVPARPKRGPAWFVSQVRRLATEFEYRQARKGGSSSILSDKAQHELAERVQDSAMKATTPLRRWELMLERPTALFVLPTFALANAGIAIEPAEILAALHQPLALGITLGLVVGKFVGITGFCWLVLRFRLGRLPTGMRLGHIAGVGLLGGVGFSMSIFIANLGFATEPDQLVVAKAAILVGSLIAGLLGYSWLRLLTRADS
ncbi:Na+/H+ antiporter NhaA [Marinobacterium arenosum]|uniref:Na+/H+ antiporter NhaA n=1 Tax=Marinobacterium arenosum TaxID=2862496 RepID=UPI001C93C6C2|nr:Na+/H+ antiporter NhaA [Marinobacterium arenosum]MBY4677337.1 Na+/H+ antiporter NhaA [Marinobacterium arenosum]